MTNYEISQLSAATSLASGDLFLVVKVADHSTPPAGSGGSDQHVTFTNLQTAVVSMLWAGITNGEATLPRDHQDDSASFSATPSTGVLLLTSFRAVTNGTYGHVLFQTGGTGQSGNTLSKAGLYSVAANGNMTLLSGCTSTTFAGTYTGQTIALTTSQTLTAGSVYAVGILQVGTTSASLLGSWCNAMFLGGTPVFCQTIGSQSDLPSSITSGSLSTYEFPVYCELHS